MQGVKGEGRCIEGEGEKEMCGKFVGGARGGRGREGARSSYTRNVRAASASEFLCSF